MHLLCLLLTNAQYGLLYNCGSDVTVNVDINAVYHRQAGMTPLGISGLQCEFQMPGIL